MAKGLDWMLGVHNHERIQHKDFATFLNDDVWIHHNIEIPQKYGEVAANINTGVENGTGLSHHDSSPRLLHVGRETIHHRRSGKANQGQ